MTPVGPWNTLFEKSHEHALQRQKVNSMVDRPILRRAAQLAQHLAPSSPHLVKKSAKSRLQMQRPSLSLLRIRLCTSEPPSVSPPWFFFCGKHYFCPRNPKRSRKKHARKDPQFLKSRKTSGDRFPKALFRRSKAMSSLDLQMMPLPQSVLAEI